MTHPFNTLTARDPTHPHRAELLAAGVPTHTALALYPECDFNGLLSLLTERLIEIGVDHAFALQRPMKELNRRSGNLMFRAPKALQERWFADFKVWYWGQESPEVEVFNDLLRPTLSTGEAYYAYLLDLIYWCWWTMVHRSELPDHLRKKGDELAGWVIKKVLLLPSA